VHRRLTVLVVMLFAVGAARAQSSAPPDQAEQNRILLERVQKLEQRLAEVEAKLGAATAPVETAANVPVGRQAGIARSGSSARPGGRTPTRSRGRTGHGPPDGGSLSLAAKYADLATWIFPRRTRRERTAASISASLTCTWLRRFLEKSATTVK